MRAALLRATICSSSAIVSAGRSTTMRSVTDVFVLPRFFAAFGQLQTRAGAQQDGRGYYVDKFFHDACHPYIGSGIRCLENAFD
jgi:hypothetical protein